MKNIKIKNTTANCIECDEICDKMIVIGNVILPMCNSCLMDFADEVVDEVYND